MIEKASGNAMPRTRSPVTALIFFALCYGATAENAQTVDVNDVVRITIEMLKMTQEQGKNFVMSPISVHSVLGTLLSGAGGNSAAEIESLLPSDAAAVQDKFFNVLKESKGGNDEQILKSASQIFYKKGIEINENFRANAEKNFNMSFIEMNPAESNVSEAINHWLRNATNMTIEPDDLASDSHLVVINTIAFRDNWKEEFDVEDTSDGDFHPSVNESVSVAFMVKKDAELVSGKNEDLGAKWIQLPYSSGLKMLLLLPTERFGLQELIRKMSDHDFLAMANDDKVNKTSIVIPTFDFENIFSAEKILKKLGVNEIFTNQANLTGISKSNAPLQVDKIVQSCHIRVDEKETTASAKTVGTLDFHRGSLSFPADAFFIADEPFLFFILAREIPVFAGMISYPKESVN